MLRVASGYEEGPQGKSHPFLSFLLLGWPAERPEVHHSGSGTPPHPSNTLQAREHLARKETGSRRDERDQPGEKEGVFSSYTPFSQTVK